MPSTGIEIQYEENYLLVGSDPKNKDHIITASELDQALLAGDLKTSTVIIFDSCFSGGFINWLARPGRTIITACTNWEYAQSRPYLIQKESLLTGAFSRERGVPITSLGTRQAENGKYGIMGI